MQKPQSGFPIGSFGPYRRPSRRRNKRKAPLPPQWKNPSSYPQENMDEDLVPRMEDLSLSSTLQAQSTRQASLPTWGQIKKLTADAERVVLITGKTPTPIHLFLAIIALLSCQVSGSSVNKSYWAYIPNPPLFHPTAWGDKNLKVFTNNTNLMGGLPSSLIPFKSTDNVNLTGYADEAPLCFVITGTPPPGCLPINYRSYYTDSPSHKGTKRSIWGLNMISLGYHTYNESYVNLSSNFNSLIESCTEKYPKKDIYWKNIHSTGYPRWLECGFLHKANIYYPVKSNLTIYDFSVSSPNYNYTAYIINNTNKYTYNKSLPTDGEPLTRWFTPGLVTPIYQSSASSHNRTGLYNNLFRLLAATNMVLLYRPSSSTPVPYGIRACVNAPHAILVGKTHMFNITQMNNAYHITCTNCLLTNCINSGLPKNYTTFLIVHQPSYVLLPVKLNEPWFDDVGYQVMERLNNLMRPKRFVATLILGITALISIIASLAISTTALIQNQQTAHHVNTLTHNISLALTLQEKLDRNLETRVDALEDTVIYLGNQIQNLKTQLTTRCHVNYKWICITPAPYNETEQS
ncbi:endogenous retrovirus group K member 21 Env polyprotein-like [Tamandua tetradactyla]|uniref:endogenous retrovirus group K member 21 Env polyprotein-like n=1 Tax=Tamandua tetradactyla TaxID=48850 RepID=UPI0040548C29